MKHWSILKVGINRNQFYIILLSIVLILIGILVFSWGYMNPELVEESEIETLYNYQIDSSSNSEAVTNTSLYNRGETYERLGHYQIKAFPRFNNKINFTGQNFEGSEDYLEIKYFIEVSRNQEVFWTENIKEVTMEEGENKNIVLNITSINQRTNEIVHESGHQVNIRFIQKFKLMSNGDNIEEEEREIGLSQNFYEYNSGEISFSREREVITDTHEQSPTYMYYSLIPVFIGVLISIITMIISKITIDDVDIWHYNLYVNSEWFEQGSHTSNNLESSIEVNEISSLKNISQITNQPIIYDKHIKTIFVISEGTIYYMSHPNKEIDFFI